ncbi:uncharacterized protein LOC134220529 [Armigeres subalbatus]|uniref:uncharacterized protein LOC134220529 n=1 Tax=Armigeres subalbatus TaxID=124917 RepID=UPI002ED5B33C
MPRVGAIFDKRRFLSLQSIHVVLCVIMRICEAHDYPKCARGVCVPQYLCANKDNKVITDGNGLLDLRSLGNDECPNGMTCCGVGTGSSGVDYSCDGECVEESECGTRFDTVDLRIGKQVCAHGKVCCKIQRPQTITYFEPWAPDVVHEANMILMLTPNQRETCRGRCVLQSQCSDYNPVKDLINRMFKRDECPVGLMCCNNVKIARVCQGVCIPMSRCARLGIFSRHNDAGCPKHHMCYETPMPLAQATQTKCNGKCLPVSQCPMSGSGFINLRFANGCAFGEVCCSMTQMPSCQGTCATMDQCADDPRNKTIIDLRSTSNNCLLNQVCCYNLKQTDVNSSENCDGTCVSQQQCPELNSWRNDIDLRLSGNKCPFNTVCCKNPVLKKCDGSCVSEEDCNDTKNFDLRSSQSCPLNKVCCKKLKQVKINSTTQNCDGICVHSSNCPSATDSNSINLRLANGHCPDDKICCATQLYTPLNSDPSLSPANVCEGTCLPRNQCSDAISIDLRSSSMKCLPNQVCCKVSKYLSECDGQCVTPERCSDSPLINLRFTETSSCQNNEVCCKNLKGQNNTCKGQCVPHGKCATGVSKFSFVDLRTTSDSCPSGMECCQEISTCEGKCVSENQCEDTPSDIYDGINLRVTMSQLCGANQVCCKNIKHSQSSNGCDGTCVPAESCTIDLRFASGQCPANQVCCNIPTKSNSSDILHTNRCDGSCVPDWQCAPSDVDLRISTGTCPLNRVCCKSSVPVCNGKCVPATQCDDIGINLRHMQNPCAENLICCQNVKMQSCPGRCIPANQCSNYAPGKVPIDLRKTDIGCSNGDVCCMIPPLFEPPMMGTSGVDHNIPALPSGPGCSFGSDPSNSFLSKPDVKWLVSVWSRQEILGELRQQFLCTGTLLKPDLVLTSADCVEDKMPQAMYVRIDDFNLKPLNTLSPRREFKVSEVIIHPDYSSTEQTANLAVLKLAKNATRSSSTCLPSLTKLNPTDQCFLIGWNKLNIMDDSTPNATPDKHLVTGLTMGAKCNEGYICSDDRKQSSQRQCADAFQGSPVICLIGNGPSWVQVGLTSAASEACNVENVPHSFVSVATYESWIREQIAPSFTQIPMTADPERRYLPPVI